MRCRWDVGYCDVFPTYIRFYLGGRKNSQYGGDFWDVAVLEKPGEMGVYHIALMAKRFSELGTGLMAIVGSPKASPGRPRQAGASRGARGACRVFKQAGD